MSKNNSHLQIDIFCHFDFCHSRRNGLFFYIDSQPEFKTAILLLQNNALRSGVNHLEEVFSVIKIHMYFLSPLIEDNYE